MNAPSDSQAGPASRSAFLVPEGTTGDGVADDTAAVQRTLDRCAERGGGRVLLAGGRFRCGALRLGDRTTLEIAEGAVLVADEDPAAYPIGLHRWQGRQVPAHAPLIGATDARRVGLVGRGTVDGRGAPWWRRSHERTLTHPRPRLIEFENCRDVLIEGLLLIDSPSWTVHPVDCDEVTVRGLTIRSPHDSPNTDGINPDGCRSVRIADCRIDTGDDCIAIKTGTEDLPAEQRRSTERVIVTGCVFEHGHGGVVLGSEMSGGIREVVVADCIMRDTDRGIRLKTRRGRGGVLEDLRVANVQMQRVGCPLVVDCFYFCAGGRLPEVQDPRPRPVDVGTPAVRRLTLSGIDARDVAWCAAFIHGLPEAPVAEIALRDVHAEADRDPACAAGAPAMMQDALVLRGAGLHAVHVDGLDLRWLRIGTLDGQPPLALRDCLRVSGDGT